MHQRRACQACDVPHVKMMGFASKMIGIFLALPRPGAAAAAGAAGAAAAAAAAAGGGGAATGAAAAAAAAAAAGASSSCAVDERGFAEAYTLSGCSNPAHCGVYVRVEAQCLKDFTEGGVCGKDAALCAGAPVYELRGTSGGGGGGGSILYRWSPNGQSSSWLVGASARRSDCESYGSFLRSLPIAGSAVHPPAAEGHNSGDGWYDDEARLRGTVTIAPGGA